MKKLRKIFALLIAMVMVLGMSTAVFAAPTTGSGTITINNTTVGQTYKLYKLFDAKYSAKDGTYYTLPEGKTADELGDYFVVDKAGNVLPADPEAKYDASDSAFQTWAAGFGTELTAYETEADGNTITWTNVPYGYYYIESSLGTFLTVDSVNPNAEVYDKNEDGPSILEDAKTVLSITDNVSGETKKENLGTAKVGDTVHYQIQFTATNFVRNKGEETATTIYEYNVSDTPTNQTLSNFSVVVTDKDGVDHEVEVEGFTATGFDITIPWATGNATNGYKSIYSAPATITITYDGTITTAAAADEDGATNQASIGYNGDKTPGTEIVIETDSCDIVKTNNLNELLEGAVFSLKDGGKVVKVSAVEVAEGEVETYKVDPAGSDTFTITNGQVHIIGLDANGSYTLAETTAPEGYNPLSGDTDAFTTAVGVATIANNVWQSGGMQVVNQAGAELPSTGGIGTTIFYIIGAILVIGAGVVLVTRRRMNAN